MRKNNAVRAAPQSTRVLSSEVVRSLIAEAAYRRAEKRGFAPGYEMEDWLAAETEVVEALRPDGLAS